MKKLIKYKFIFLSACSSEEASGKIILEGGLNEIEKTIERPEFLDKERFEKEEKERLQKEEKERLEKEEKERLEKEEKERLFKDLKKNIENQKEKDVLEDIFKKLDPETVEFFKKEKEKNIKGVCIENEDALARKLEPGIWFYGNSGFAIKNYTTKPATMSITENDEFIVPKNVYEEELNKYPKSSSQYIELSKFKPNTWYKHRPENERMKQFLLNYKNPDKKIENLEKLKNFFKDPKDENIKIKNINIGENDWEDKLEIREDGEELLIVFNSVDTDAGRSDAGLNGAIKKACNISGKTWKNITGNHIPDKIISGHSFISSSDQIGKINKKILIINICGNYSSDSYASSLKSITDNIYERIQRLYYIISMSFSKGHGEALHQKNKEQDYISAKYFTPYKKIKIIAHAISTGGFAFDSQNFGKEKYIKEMVLDQAKAHVRGFESLKEIGIKVELILNNFKGELEKILNN